jgi:hypothetical protein
LHWSLSTGWSELMLTDFPLSSFLGGGGNLPLFVVLSHVDAINTTIVVLDPFFLLDTYGYEFF